jgi:hypothetical protein
MLRNENEIIRQLRIGKWREDNMSADVEIHYDQYAQK